jgi:hypothetical protein
VKQSALAHLSGNRFVCHCLHALHHTRHLFHLRGCVPQAKLPVAGGVDVPVGERRHPGLEPRALGDEGGERRGGHDFDGAAVRRGVGGVECGHGLPSIAEVGVVRSMSAGLACQAKDLDANWGEVRRRAWAPKAGYSASRAGKLAFPTSQLPTRPRALCCDVRTTPRPPRAHDIFTFTFTSPLQCTRLQLPARLLHPRRLPSLCPPVNGAASPLDIVLLECCGASAH